MPFPAWNGPGRGDDRRQRCSPIELAHLPYKRRSFEDMSANGLENAARGNGANKRST
jgi:hypothetical protein